MNQLILGLACLIIGFATFMSGGVYIHFTVKGAGSPEAKASSVFLGIVGIGVGWILFSYGYYILENPPQ